MLESPGSLSPPTAPLDCTAHMPMGPDGEAAAQAGLAPVALGLVGSEILKIAAAVRALLRGAGAHLGGHPDGFHDLFGACAGTAGGLDGRREHRMHGVGYAAAVGRRRVK